MKRTLSAIFILLGFFAASSTTFASFPDVPREHPNYEAINYVQDKKIVSGHPDGTYKPDDKIDRAAFTKIIIESKNYTKEEIDACGSANFKDIPDGIWYDRYVCMAQKTKVVDGYPDGTFGGEKLINLAEASKIIVNAFGYEVQPDPQIWYKPYIEELSRRNALPITLTSFDHQLTRGEMAEIIYRLRDKIEFKSSLTYSNLDQKDLPTEAEKLELVTADKTLNYQYSVTEFQQNVSVTYIANIRSIHNGLNTEPLNPLLISGEDFLINYENFKKEALEIGPHGQDSTLIDSILENIETKREVFAQDVSNLADLHMQLSELDPNSSQEEMNHLIQAIKVLHEDIVEKIQVSDQTSFQVYINFLSQYDTSVVGLDALIYANKLLTLFNQTLDAYAHYADASLKLDFMEGDLTLLEDQRQISMDQLETIRTQILALGPYGEDNSLFDATLENLDVRYKLLAEEESQMMELWKAYQESPDTFSQTDVEKWDALNASILSKLKLASSVFSEGLWRFRSKHDF